jgi:hypothetical protein
MSTEWRPIPDIPFAKLFDGCLEKYGIREVIVEDATERFRYLQGPDGFLEAFRGEDGTCSFTRRGVVPWTIFDAIAEEFEIEWVSEYDYRFWGFATEKDHAVKIKLTEQDLAAAELMAARTDDLPKA